MSAIARALGISRPHLSSSSRRGPSEARKARVVDDEGLLARIREVVDARPTCGYRRVTAHLNRAEPDARVNHKRVYRVMREQDLLLPKHTGRPSRPHEGRVVTLHSDTRWCSDMFELRCWNGEKVHVAFALDCCDREVLGFVASDHHLDGQDVRDLIATSVEHRFGTTETPRRVEWLTDNGPPYVAHETRRFAAACGLAPRNTPAYSPESNGMAEAFVKTFKRDYAYLADLPDAKSVIAELPRWFHDYNENAPHKGLKMLSPRQFRRAQAS